MEEEDDSLLSLSAGGVVDPREESAGRRGRSRDFEPSGSAEAAAAADAEDVVIEAGGGGGRGGGADAVILRTDIASFSFFSSSATPFGLPVSSDERRSPATADRSAAASREDAGDDTAGEEIFGAADESDLPNPPNLKDPAVFSPDETAAESVAEGR